MPDVPPKPEPAEHPATRHHRAGALRPWLAGLSSALLPGTGQWMAGRRRRGAILIGISVVVIAAGSWVALNERLLLLTWTVQPDALLWLLVGNGLVLGFRVFASADAYLAASEATPKPHGVAGMTAALIVALAAVVILATPHAVAGYADVTQYDVITTVFSPARTSTPPPTPSPATTATQPAEVSASPTPTPTPATTTQATTTSVPVIPARIWDGTARLNVLLLGGDMRPSSKSVRTDTMILTSIEPQTGHIAMFSIPRNMARVPVPDELGIWKCDCFPGILNALWRYGDEHAANFPDQGIPSGATAIKLAVGELTGLPVHYYALVNLTGFVELIDALGGVDMTVPKRLYDPRYGAEDGQGKEVIDIAPGDYHMDGHTALAYARSRRSSDDYNRMGRQRCVLRAIAAQADSATVVRAFPAIAASIKRNLSTDIPIEALPQFIELLPLIDADNIVSVRFVPPQFTGPKTPDFYNTPDLQAIREAIDIVFELPPQAALAELGLERTRDECG